MVMRPINDKPFLALSTCQALSANRAQLFIEFKLIFQSFDCHLQNGRQIQDDARRPCSSSLTGGKPHFFKIVVSSIQYKQLRIPPKFAKKYGKNLSKTACLTVPNGAVWKVEVVKSGDVIRLSSGWEKFMENFSIKLGHFLVFRYEGNSCFYVLIFDMSATEIKYPTLVRKVDNETDCNVGAAEEVGVPMKMLDESPSKKISGVKFLVPKSEETEADVGNAPIEISDDSPSCSRKRKEATTTPYPGPCSKKRKEAPPKLYGGPTGLPIPRMGVKRKGKESVLRKAEAFQSRSPCFMVIMPKSSLSDSHPLRIPTSYGHKYLSKEHSKSLSLQVVGNSKRWTARYSVWNCGSVVIHGWKVFAWENNLEAGNICVFQMIKGCSTSYMVHIFRDTDDPSHP
ncbi:hypothetical protein Droror1_Dr00019460 [Drosera rotundifolia]